MPQQVNPDEMIGILEAEYQPRREPNFALAKAIPTHLSLIGLRAFWPMSVIDYQQPECVDICNGYNLQAAAALGNVRFGRGELQPLAQFLGGANNYLFRADGGAGNWADILGTETYFHSGVRGLTLGGWFSWSALPGAVNVLIAKDDTGANRQYGIYLSAANLLNFIVWPGPVNLASSATIQTGWNHCVGIYDAATQTMSVVLNGTVTSGAVGAAPAALGDTAASFTVGADGAGGQRFTGNASMCFLCSASLTSAIAQNLYQQTRTAYNV